MSKREKTEKALDDAMFRFQTARDGIFEYFPPEPDEAAAEPPRRHFNTAVLALEVQGLEAKWETIVNAFMAFRDCRNPHDAAENAQITAKEDDFKILRSELRDVKNRAADTSELQRIADNPPPSNVEQLNEAVTASQLGWASCNQEMATLEAWTAGLPENLSYEMISQYRIRLDNLHVSLDPKMSKYAEELAKLEPPRSTHWWAQHRANVQDLQRRILESTTVLLSKMRKPSTITPSTPAISTVSTTSGSTRLQLEKLKPPVFGGDHTEWLLFKGKFKDVVEVRAGFDDAAQGYILVDSVPKEAQERIKHLRLASEMFTELDKIYGDKKTSLSIITRKMSSLSLSKKSECEKIIEINVAINHYSKLLASLGTDAINHVRYNDNILSHLISILPTTYRNRWFDTRISASTTSNEWDDFEKWIKTMEIRANAEKLTEMRMPDKPTPIKPKISMNSAGISTSGVEATTCPVCTVHHERAGVKTNIIIDCPKWREMTTVNERATLVETMNGCRRCLRWDHQAGAECSGPKGFQGVREKIKKHGSFTCNKALTPGTLCAGDHSSYLCGNTVGYCAAISTFHHISLEFPNPVDDPITLVPIQQFNIQGVSSSVFFDNGSTACMITYSLAKKLNLRGTHVSYSIQTVETKGWELRDGLLYDVVLTSNSGVTISIPAYGSDSIAESRAIIVDTKLKKNLPDNIPEAAWHRPEGPVDLLIGSNRTCLMPKDAYYIDNLRIKTSAFGSGYCLQGSSPNVHPFGENHHKTTIASCNIRIQTLQIHVTSIQSIPSTRVVTYESPVKALPQTDQNQNSQNYTLIEDTISHYAQSLMEIPFLEAEEEAVNPPPRCSRCKSCADCHHRNLLHTDLENAQLDVIASKVILDVDKREIHVTYPFTVDPSVLGNGDINNMGQAISMARAVETRIIKNHMEESYNAEIRKYQDIGGIFPLSKEEVQNYPGPVHFIAHHEVLKPSSNSTPCRIVANSALINRTCGKSLNSILMKGPNCLNSLVDVLIRFRSYEVALVFDLTKAYMSLITGLIEMMVRLIVWRDCDRTRDWQIYGFKRVIFGDQCASVQLEVAKNKCAEAGRELDPEAAIKLERDFYVDDCVSGGSQEQVDRFRGNKMPDGKYDGTMPSILGLGGLSIKALVVSGEEDPEAQHLLGDYVLGILYLPQEDLFVFNFAIHLSPKKRGVRLEPPIDLTNLYRLDTIILTPRLVVGMVNSFYDPLGLMCAWTIKFKILMQKMVIYNNHSLDWDDPLPNQLVKEWHQLIIQTLEMGAVHFPRACRPKNSAGSPSYVGFWDGALPAWACCVYARYPMIDGSYHVQLMAAKARLSPSAGTSVPKVEVSGLLGLSRLMRVVVKAVDETPSSVVLLGDSECSIAMLEKSGPSLAPYFCKRVGEIKTNIDEIKQICPVEEVLHIGTELNPSDLPTRGLATPNQIQPESIWQQGPQFLQEERENWPVSRDFISNLPEEIHRVKLAQFFTDFNLLPFNLNAKRLLLISLTQLYSDNINKVTGIVARLLNGWKSNIENARNQPSVKDLEEARILLLRVNQVLVLQKYKQKKLKSLMPSINKHGVLVTQGRLGAGMKQILGQEELPILLPGSRLATLIMWDAHRQMHRATPADTAARSRATAWIIRPRQLAISISNKCPLCRILHVRLGRQIMGNRKPEHLLQCPPFTHTACDLLGPYKCRSMVNSRVKGTMKVWGVVYLCQATGAARAFLCPGYDTGSFVTAHDKFLAICGNPKTITSDRGSQLRKASRVLDYTAAEDPSNWNWEAIQGKGAQLGTEWVFLPPGTQWRNRSEAAVKVLKRTMDLTINSQEKLNFCEMETLLFTACNAMNERPLTVRVFDESTFHPLTVNQLLLARTGTSIASVDYQAGGNAMERLEFREELENVWWNQFYSQVLPSLVPCQKWKDEYPNRMVGDIVLVHYPGIKKAEYRLAKVSKILPDQKGNVRTLEVLMRPRDKRVDGSVRYVHKDLEPLALPVQRTALIMPAAEVHSLCANPTKGAGIHLTRNHSGADRVTVGCTTIVGEPRYSTVDSDSNCDSREGLFIPLSALPCIPAFQLKSYDDYEEIKAYASDLKME